jgi:cytochrome c-type biogenesis protein CcmE
MGHTIKIAVSLLIIGGSATYLLASTMTKGDNLEYFHSADEVIVHPEAFRGQKIRVGGKVQKGTVFQKKGTLEYRFDVRPIDGPMLKFAEARGKTITVAFTGVMPDTFKDDSDVVASGHVGDDGTFVATDVITKCPSKEGYKAYDAMNGS